MCMHIFIRSINHSYYPSLPNMKTVLLTLPLLLLTLTVPAQSPPQAIEHNYYVGDSYFYLIWTPSSGASTYFIELAYDPGFLHYVNGYEGTEVLGQDIGPNKYIEATGLFCNTTYYFRLRASGSSGVSDYSNVAVMQTTGTGRMPTLTGPTSISCPGNTATYWSDLGNFGDFNWTVNGGTIVSGCQYGCGESVVVRWDNVGTHSISVRYRDYWTNCTSYTKTINVSVQGYPTQYTVGGGGGYCSGGSVSVTLSGSQTGVNYQLRKNGVNTGAPLAGTGSALTWSGQTAGTYTVVASNSVGCAQTMNGSATATENPMPTEYTMGGGGSYCLGGSGLAVTLSGSQTGVSYQLRKDGVNTGSPVAGTGGQLTWTNQPTGNYTAYATNNSTGCGRTMSGSTPITTYALPQQYTVGGGGAYCPGDNGTTVTLSGSQVGVNYQLRYNGNNTGSPVAGNGATLSWTNLTEGTYTIQATNTTTGCTQLMSGSAVSSLHALPNDYTVGGGGSFCVGGVSVTLSGSQAGLYYQLRLNGTNTGSPQTGTGGALNWSNQSTPGTYTVVATNPGTTCNRQMTGSATVTGNPLPEQYTVSGGGDICYGSGASITLSSSQSGVSYQLQLNNTDTGAPIAGTGSSITWANQTTEGTYTVVATNSYGCTAGMSGSATITTLLTTAELTGPDKVRDTPITLAVTTGTNYTYQWTRDGDVLPGATASTLTVATPGNYQVQISIGQCTRSTPTHFVALEPKRYYNGTIAAMHWRTDKAHNVEGEEFKGTYVFDYDDKYQLKEANFGQTNHVLHTFTPAGNTFRVSDMAYDANGNIQTLRRYNETGERIHNFNYAYQNSLSTGTGQNEVQTNKLTSVSGYVNAYAYNAIGQMIGEDKVDVGKDQYVEYDVSGKVRKVYSHASKHPDSLKVEFIYDDRGFRLAKKNYADSTTTWYIRDASGSVLSIYEEDLNDATHQSLRQTEVPIYGAGKLGTIYPEQNNATAYELTDHLGNVRAIVKEQTEEYIATIEDNEALDYRNPRVREMAVFENLFETEKRDAHFNHTPGGEYSSYLYWRDGFQDSSKSVGPATALKVHAGDTIRLEAWARYENKIDYARDLPLAMLTQFLGNTFAYKGGFEELNASQVASHFNAGLALAGFGSDGPDDTRPFSYLNYMLFDNNTGFVDAGWMRVPLDAGFNAGEEGLPNRHRRVYFEQPIVVPQNGYIYVWLSNESEDTEVWFDDLKVTRGSARVVQATDYGPWGDVLREQKKEPDDMYRWYYQGQYAERDEETGWNHFELRQYDAVIGRWTTVDPKRIGFSPYIGMANNPLKFTDPDGGGPEDWYQNNTTGELKWINGSGPVEGYTHLGEDLTFDFSSFIDRADWDGPNPWFDVSGEKLFNSVTLDFTQDAQGNLTGLANVSFASKIMTNDGGFTGVPWNSLGNSKISVIGKNNFVVGFENHASVPFIEALGLAVQGYARVDVAQKLMITGSISSGTLNYKSFTDIFPSASLSINGTRSMYYRQPLYRATHGLFTRPAPALYERQGISLKRGGY